MSTKKPSPWWKNSHHLMMLGCVAVMAYVLLGSSDSNAGWASTLFLLACPLMHLVMMRGMSGHGCHDKSDDCDKETIKRAPEVSQEKPSGYREF